MNALSSAFATLLERQRSAEERERLHRLRDELGLREDDALWRFVALMEEQLAKAAESHAPCPAMMVPAPPRIVPPGVWICVGMALQTLFGAACVCIGARIDAQVLSWAAPARHGLVGWIVAALALPAGWLSLLFALPVAGFAARLGWRLRAAGERGWGWAVMMGAVVGAGACAVALWRIL